MGYVQGMSFLPAVSPPRHEYLKWSIENLTGRYQDPRGEPKFGFLDGNFVEVQKYPVLIPGFEKFVQIVCGENHALALDTTGHVWGWGIGKQNELGRRRFGHHQETLIPRLVRVYRSPIKYIASGEHFFLCY